MNAQAGIDTNLQGQRLGRKGRITRDRILAVTRELIDKPGSEPLSISSVARRAELRVSSIYNYFPDLTDLFMTVLEPAIENSRTEYLGLLETYWEEAELDARCSEFVDAFHRFWAKNVRLLHVRNHLAQQHDPRVLSHRIDSARRIVGLLKKQMDAPSADEGGITQDMASVIYAGMERVVTIVTDELLEAPYPSHINRSFGEQTLIQQARLMALAIREERARRARR